MYRPLRHRTRDLTRLGDVRRRVNSFNGSGNKQRDDVNGKTNSAITRQKWAVSIESVNESDNRDEGGQTELDFEE